MPKFEVDVMRVNGLDMVPAFALDRANAEIEKSEAIMKKLGRLVLEAWGCEEISFSAPGIHIAADGTVTEIGHG